MIMNPLPAFKPLPLLSSPHAQTIIGTVWPAPGEPPSATRLVELADGDRIALEVSTPPDWRPDGVTVVLVHGLCGCHRSAYMVRLARRLVRRGARAVRMNLRGCGSGRGLARRIYHSGRSDDVLAALDALHAESPQSRTHLVGFSLGGNLVLKLAGELGPRAGERFEQVVAVCPPMDLMACSRKLARPSNRIYDRWFVTLLRKDVRFRHTRFDDLPRVELPRRLTLAEFDDVYTAPQTGFRGVEDYYTRASSAPLVPRIDVRCRILLAADDPVIEAGTLDGVRLPEQVEVLRTDRGGHLGFLGAPGRPGGLRWMDALVLDWLEGPGQVCRHGS